MEKKLTRVKTNVYFYKDGKKIEGFPPRVSGDLSDVSGDLTGVSGDLTNVWGYLTDMWGNLTGLSGNLTGVRGNLSGVQGDLSDCAITDEERAAGVDINDLIDSAPLPEPISPPAKHD